MKTITIKYQGDKPYYANEYAVGADVYSLHEYIITPGEVVFVDTGLRIEPEQGYFVYAVPRSSLAKKGLILVNSIGIIDPDYRGTIKFAYYNYMTNKTVHISKGERIGQLIIAQHIRANFVEDKLSETKRGEGGFGSTGK